MVREILRRSDRWSEATLLAMTPEELRTLHAEVLAAVTEESED